MIYHFKDNLQEISYIIKTSLQYSKDFFFIPIQVKESKEFIVQTPKLFAPYGIQKNDRSKDYIMLSFQNKTNDKHTTKFLDDLQYIYSLVQEHFKGRYQVNHFLNLYLQ